MQSLLDVDWIEHLADCNHDVDVMWDKFYRKFKAVESECVPKKRVGIGITKYRPLGKQCCIKRKRKYRLWKRYLETKDG